VFLSSTREGRFSVPTHASACVGAAQRSDRGSCHRAEVAIAVRALNRMIPVAKPLSVRVTSRTGTDRSGKIGLHGRRVHNTRQAQARLCKEMAEFGLGVNRRAKGTPYWSAPLRVDRLGD
jgi:hypothetical protein